MARRSSPPRKPWYNEAQSAIIDYQQASIGWFSFTERPNYMEIVALLGPHGEKVEAVRAEIAQFDRRFFLSRWLRRPFSDVEYKRSRLHCYEMAEEIKGLAPLAKAESETKASLNTLLGRQAEQKKEGPRRGEPLVTEDMIARSRQRHNEASKVLVQAINTVNVSVNARYKQVSWFSGMHTALKKLGKLLTKTSRDQSAALKKQGVDVSTSAADAVSATPATISNLTVPRPPSIITNTPSKSAAQPAAAVNQPVADNQLALVVVPASSTTSPVSYWSNQSPRKQKAAIVDIETLPEITALVEAAKSRPRATEVALLQQQFNEDKKRLKAMFAKISREAPQRGAEWLDFQLTKAHKAINTLLQFSYHTDKIGKACFEKATDLTQQLITERDTQIKKMREGNNVPWYVEALDRWARQFDEKAEEVRKDYQRIRESSAHVHQAAQELRTDFQELRAGYAVLGEKLSASGQHIESHSQQLTHLQDQVVQAEAMLASRMASSQPIILTPEQRRELELIQQRGAQITAPVSTETVRISV